MLSKKPKHLAIIIGGHVAYAKKQKLPIDQLYKKIFLKINDIMDFQVRMDIPIVTLSILSAKAKSFDNLPNIIDALVEFFEKLKDNKIIADNKIKVSILGKWYDLPGRLVENIKAVIDETRDYDSYFLNLCINYDGQEEIIDACKMIGRKIQAGKLDPDAIDRGMIKDAIYSSYFMPPDIIIKTGENRKLKGFLLWDSTNSHIYFSNRLWMELTRDDIKRAIDEWTKG